MCFAAWWILQHIRGYTPFNTRSNFNVTINEIQMMIKLAKLLFVFLLLSSVSSCHKEMEVILLPRKLYANNPNSHGHVFIVRNFNNDITALYDIARQLLCLNSNEVAESNSIDFLKESNKTNISKLSQKRSVFQTYSIEFDYIVGFDLMEKDSAFVARMWTKKILRDLDIACWILIVKDYLMIDLISHVTMQTKIKSCF